MKKYGFVFTAALVSQLALAAPVPNDLRLIETSPEFAQQILIEFPADATIVSSSLVLVPRDLIATLSERSHEITGRCGGFMDVTSEPQTAELFGDIRPRAALDLPRLDQRDPAIVSAVADIRGDNIESFDRLFSKTFKTRYARSEEGARAPEWLRDQWAKMARDANRGDVIVELGEAPDGYAQHSVRITIPGSDASLPIAILGAHLDSINRRGGDTAPGADDDGSGIAAITEAYRVMLSHNLRPKATIQIFGYAAEELGLLGSRVIAQHYQQKNIKVRGVMQLDMVAWAGKTNAVTFIMDNVDHDLTVWSEQLYGMYVGGNIKEDTCGYGCSDHASWHRYGYPSVMPFESMFDDMNNRLHTPDDRWDEYLKPEHAALFAKLAYAFAAQLAQ